MKGFFGAFFVFLIWTSGCIYFVSTREATSDSSVQQIVNEKDNLEKNTPKTKDQEPPVVIATKSDSPTNSFARDSLDLYGIEHETSSLLAEEIQKSIAISDTIDITSDEPILELEKELNSFMGSSFSSNVFYPRYNNTDLILDKELVVYATELKKILKENPDKKVTILGHTDNVGSSVDNFNQGLKMSRQVKWYLTARRGIPRRKITATSRGEEEPIATNKTLSGRQENNRIEIIVD
ncbi:OmpA family protein [Dokdonia sp. PRO95]|uniref:OmpA family protein n=1 Tax=Dokdonia sp. PRO95 TaxID=1239415 RepID=UPI00068FF4A7|nr:OmpA family protein [Dokdonia sp. PRO95]